MMNKPAKVTVVVVSYNHEKYLVQAVESILVQEVNFDYEIVIADDGSTDNSPAVIDELTNKYPGKIIGLKASKNQGVRQNVFSSKSQLRGEYVAILDGDDYWNYEQKLQKQVDFLDQNADYNGVFHDAKIEHVGAADKVLFHYKDRYSQNYVFQENIYPADVVTRKMILPSSSAVLRLSALKKEDWGLISDNYSILWKLTCLLIRSSKFYFINETWSVYRNHQKGISKGSNTRFHRSHITFLKILLQDTFYRNFPYDIYRALEKEYENLLNIGNGLPVAERKKVFREYILNEFLRIWYYRKKVI